MAIPLEPANPDADRRGRLRLVDVWAFPSGEPEAGSEHRGHGAA